MKHTDQDGGSQPCVLWNHLGNLKRMLRTELALRESDFVGMGGSLAMGHFRSSVGNSNEAGCSPLTRMSFSSDLPSHQLCVTG